MFHVQVNGAPLCRSHSEAYITALGGRNDPQLCKCRYHKEDDAKTGADALQKAIDQELFAVTVVSGPCVDPLYICSFISDEGTHQ